MSPAGSAGRSGGRADNGALMSRGSLAAHAPRFVFDGCGTVLILDGAAYRVASVCRSPAVLFSSAVPVVTFLWLISVLRLISGTPVPEINREAQIHRGNGAGVTVGAGMGLALGALCARRCGLDPRYDLVSFTLADF